MVTDGFCPGCGRFAPVKQLLTIVRKNGGYVLLDDTQALGIFGRHEKTGNVFGTGGGGTLQRQQIIDPHVVCISSMAKGLGVPVAVLAGSRQFLKQFAETSETLTHSSPPSNAVISAAEHALQVNQSDGERIRFRLSKRIGYFKQLLSDIGLSTHQSCFPLQTLKVLPQLNSRKIYTNLLQQGVQTVLHRVRCTGKICVSFIITAKHSIAQLHQAALKLAHIVGSTATRKNREFNNEYYGFGY